MTQEFVPYTEALSLKKLEFDEYCVAIFSNNNKLSVDDGFYKQENYHKDTVLAPTFSQAFKWLLKKHNLYAVIIPTVTMYWTFKTMTIVEDMIEVPPYKHVDANDYRTYEEAELASLRKLIEMVKNKENDRIS